MTWHLLILRGKNRSTCAVCFLTDIILSQSVWTCCHWFYLQSCLFWIRKGKEQSMFLKTDCDFNSLCTNSADWEVNWRKIWSVEALPVTVTADCFYISTKHYDDRQNFLLHCTSLKNISIYNLSILSKHKVQIFPKNNKIMFI